MMTRCLSTLLILLTAWMPLGQAAMACCLLAPAPAGGAGGMHAEAMSTAPATMPCPGHMAMSEATDPTTMQPMSESGTPVAIGGTADPAEDWSGQACAHGAACSGVVAIATHPVMTQPASPAAVHQAASTPAARVGTAADMIRPPSTT